MYPTCVVMAVAINSKNTGLQSWLAMNSTFNSKGKYRTMVRHFSPKNKLFKYSRMLDATVKVSLSSAASGRESSHNGK